MKRALFTVIASAAAIAAAFPAWADGGFRPVLPRANAASVSLSLTPAVTIAQAKHVANGVALRSEARGTIALRGVPLGSNLAKAYLYWNFSDANATGAAGDAIFFDGNRVAGTKVADNPDPCWGMAGNHTYRGDVTAFIPFGRPNGDYEVMHNAVSTSGQNPWNPPEAQTLRLEGATLFLIYRNTGTTTSTVYLYDALGGSMFTGGTGTFSLNHAPVGSQPALFTMTGADGQRGAGNAYTNAISNETGTFNAVQFSGPPVAASDWDGSAGWPLPQLWDVHTHQVTLSGSMSVVVYTAGGDCLVPVAFAIQTVP